MIRKLIPIIIAVLFVQQVQARSETEARNIAEQFFTSNNFAPGTTRKVTLHRRNETPQNVPVASEDYYVYTRGDAGGFVIVSALDDCRPIIGYSTDAIFSEDNIPVQLKDILDNYSNPAQMPAHGSSGEAIQPLLTTYWDQNYPFNYYAPSTSMAAGCVAVAVAQLMKYYNYPAHGYGTAVDVNLEEHSYQWEQMPDIIPYTVDDDPGEPAKNVARLIRDAGAVIHTSYGITSGASFEYVATGMVRHFGYSKDVKYLSRVNFTHEQWMEIIREQLTQGHPILYNGWADVGHAFVVDGIDTDGLLHVNWGWSGLCDGYYDICDMTPNRDETYRKQNMLINLYPDASQEIDLEFVTPYMAEMGGPTPQGWDFNFTLIRPYPASYKQGYVSAEVFDAGGKSLGSTAVMFTPTFSGTLYQIDFERHLSGGQIYDLQCRLNALGGLADGEYSFKPFYTVNGERREFDFAGADGIMYFVKHDGSVSYLDNKGTPEVEVLSIGDGEDIVCRMAETYYQESLKVSLRNKSTTSFPDSSHLKLYMYPEDINLEDVTDEQESKFDWWSISLSLLAGGEYKDENLIWGYLSCTPGKIYKMYYRVKGIGERIPLDQKIKFIQLGNLPFTFNHDWDVTNSDYRGLDYGRRDIFIENEYASSKALTGDYYFRGIAWNVDSPNKIFVLFETDSPIYIKSGQRQGDIRKWVDCNLYGLPVGKYAFRVQYQNDEETAWKSHPQTWIQGRFTVSEYMRDKNFLTITEPLDINGGQPVRIGEEFTVTAHAIAPYGMKFTPGSYWYKPSFRVQFDKYSIDDDMVATQNCTFTVGDKEYNWLEPFEVAPGQEILIKADMLFYDSYPEAVNKEWIFQWKYLVEDEAGYYDDYYLHYADWFDSFKLTPQAALSLDATFASDKMNAYKSGDNLVIEGVRVGENICIYSTSGVPVRIIKAKSSCEEVSGLTAGLYIVAVKGQHPVKVVM